MSLFVSFSLPVTALPSGRGFGTTDSASIHLERVVPTGSTTHYLWISGDNSDSVVDTLRADSAVESFDILDKLPDRILVRIHWDDADIPLFDLINENGAILVDANGTTNGWTVVLQFPSRAELSAFYKESSTRGLSLTLLGLNESGFQKDEDYGLTRAQREALEVAFAAGYFDIPRRTTIAELAEQLGLSDQAVSERLRRGIAHFLTATLENESSE